ncbi:permease [Elusimicrobiota bacterium]
MILAFFNVLRHYAVEIIPSVALGFLLSGIIHEFVPQSLVTRHLNRKGIMPIIYVTIAGIILPLCCFGSLPVAMGFRKKGVSLGPILAFLVATPATSITAILVTLRLMGIAYTLYLCISVILMGLVIGLIGNMLHTKNIESQSEGCPMCEECESEKHHHHEKGTLKQVKSVLTFGFIDIPKEIGVELIIGILLAAAVTTITPLGNFIRNYLVSGYEYLFALIFGLVMYICSTASVPLVHAFVNQGMSMGAGIVLLLAGPITSYGTILVVRKEFGSKVLAIYLAVICVFSLIAGYMFTLVVP